MYHGPACLILSLLMNGTEVSVSHLFPERFFFCREAFFLVAWQLGNSADMAAKSILKDFSQARFVTDSEIQKLSIC